MGHLLVTNDFPPKVGGIQTYLYELWSRLPADETTVLTTSHEGAAAWDAAQPFRVERVSTPFLVPAPPLIKRIDALAAEVDASLVVLDPAFPVGAIGPNLERPYGVILHGAEVTIPARTPFVQLALRRTIRGARLVVAAGPYPAAEGAFSAGRDPGAVIIPPGVDSERFRPLDDDERRAAHDRFALGPDDLVVLGVSRLVPRKGFDVLIQAVARVADDVPELRLVIAGGGRDHGRLEALIQAHGAPARLLGRVADADLPALYGAADVFAMICRDRWAGLEQEGFGIVFLEAAAAGLPAIAGVSGGSADAVVDGLTGIVIEDPRSVDAVAKALATLVADPAARVRMGAAGRDHAQRELAYDLLAGRLLEALHTAVAMQVDALAEDEG